MPGFWEYGLFGKRWAGNIWQTNADRRSGPQRTANAAATVINTRQHIHGRVELGAQRGTTDGGS
ncbi:MAG TPA: hypothetical protein V6C97_23830 [Oculatellaceae cyanobacterium]